MTSESSLWLWRGHRKPFVLYQPSTGKDNMEQLFGWPCSGYPVQVQVLYPLTLPGVCPPPHSDHATFVSTHTVSAAGEYPKGLLESFFS